MIAAALLLGPGCVARSAEGLLPAMVAVSARRLDGSYVSAVAVLEMPGRPPELRYADGLLAFDGERLVEVNSAPRPGPAGLVRWDLGLADLASGSQVVVPLDASVLSVLAVEEGRVGLSVDGATQWVDMAGRGVGWDRRGPVLDHAGPGDGFALEQRGHLVWFRLPADDREVPMLRDVEELVAVHWVCQTTDRARAALDDRFHAVRLVRADGKLSEVDGDLREWRGTEALPVDAMSYVLDGQDHWSGPRDGSFGVAARVREGRLTLALRIRDDELRLGEDRVEVVVGDQAVLIPVEGPGGVHLEGGAQAVFTDAVDWGIGLEASFPMPLPAPPRNQLPVVVRYVDADAEGTAVLGTAPSLRALALHGSEPAPL